MTFKEGDKVSWCGVPGVVIQDFATFIIVEFEEYIQTTYGTPRKQTHQFTKDGRYFPWHKEPSLKAREE